MKRLLLVALVAIAALSLCQTAEAGPLRRVAGGVRAAVSAPFRVAARRERRMARAAAYRCN